MTALTGILITTLTGGVLSVLAAAVFAFSARARHVPVLISYAIGALLYNTIGQWLIHLYGLEGKAQEFHDLYAKWGVWVILIKGLTPIPFKLVTIVSGIAHFNVGLFVAACIITRGARFFLVAALLRQFGAPIQAFIEKRLTLVVFVIVLAIVGGYALLRYV